MFFARRSASVITPFFRTIRAQPFPLPPESPIGIPIFSTFRRSYYVDRDRVSHFKRRGPRRWTANPRTVVVAAVVGSIGFVSVYYGNLESVPYTKRKHVILLSSNVEKRLGEAQFKQMKESLKGNILPPIHPDCVRVRMISERIIRSLHKVCSDMGSITMREETAVATWPGDGGKKEAKWGVSEHEILDDKWVEQSMYKNKNAATRHLEGLNWEVLVVKDPMVNAVCMPGGKIIVFTGLLDHFRTDSEIATIIGHEVGHAVARHVAEGMTKNLWLILLQLIVLQFLAMPDLVNAMSNVLFKFPFSRRMETEADYIGLLLMACAGYNPRIAPNVYKKLGKITGDSELQNYLSTHPSSKKRAELLSHATVMEEAIAIHDDALAGHSVDGFF